MFIDKYLIPFFQWFMVIGIPTILFCVGIFFLVKIFFLPAFRSGRKKQTQGINARVISKREEIVSTYSTGRAYLYYALFEFNGNEHIEFCINRNLYKKLNYNDKVKIAHTGDRLDSLYILNSSGEKTKGESKVVEGTMRSSLNELAQKKREE